MLKTGTVEDGSKAKKSVGTKRGNVQNFADVRKCEKPYHWLNGLSHAWENAGPFG